MNFELTALIILVIASLGDLMVGVANDAVNFLNSAIGAKVAKRNIILSMAGIGLLLGAVFSDGIMEVARKGIFNPQFFTVTELIMIFTAVAVTDIILLDFFSTFGMPVSTTVSVIFELMGAAYILAIWKTGGLEAAWAAVNSSSALRILTGILLSVVIALAVGLVVQFITRLFFTFDYESRLKKWGFVWCGGALTAFLHYVLFVGSKHASFMTPELKTWLDLNTSAILIGSFVFWSLLSLMLIRLNINILKPLILLGTAALALAFAGNDLVNFIGVSVGGVYAYLGADLSTNLPTPTAVLIIAGLAMVVVLFTSKKARTVTSTEVNLASQKKHVVDHFEAHNLATVVMRMVVYLYRAICFIIPILLRRWIASRFARPDVEHQAAYDLIRASVNLMTAAALISIATAKKLPLSTTFVTFMVAMGTSLADGVWDRASAPHRITGVFMVIGSWFVTAAGAFVLAGILVSILYIAKTLGLVILVALLIVSVYKLFHLHEKRSREKEVVLAEANV